MHAILTILSRPEVERMGWLLLHFVWQGVALAAMLAILLFGLRRASSNIRYLAACGALALMAACPLLTWPFLPASARVAEVTGSVAVAKPDVASLPAAKFATPADTVSETPGIALDSRRDSVRDSTTKALRTATNDRLFDWRLWVTWLLPWGVAVWLVGVVIMSLRLLFGWRAVQRLRRSVSQPASPEQQTVLARLVTMLKVTWPVRLVESALVEVPTVIGWLRPVILLPAAPIGLSPEQFEALLAHELAHIRRHDYLLNLVQTMIETVLFYHPAVWWVSRRIRQERENCCDDWAIRACGNRISYARALIQLEEDRTARAGLALASTGGQLLPRIRRILGAPEMSRSRAGYWLAGVGVLVVLLATATAIGISISTAADNAGKEDSGPLTTRDATNVNARSTPGQGLPIEPTLLSRIVSGHVVDAETGRPVEGFIYESATFVEGDPSRFHWNGEAISPGSQRDGTFGIVVKNRLDWPMWERIVAPGYVPQPITDKPIILRSDTVLDKFEVRMRRGQELSGRVVDQGGKPVAAASVYLLRNQGGRQVVRDPAVTAQNQQFEMLGLTHAATDADGHFKLSGWNAESGRVAILAGEINLWVAAIPADANNWTIHLPHPATIECLVDDGRAERETLYDLELATTSRKGWEKLRAYQFALRSKDGHLAVPNHAPGEYQLTRRRLVVVKDYEGEFRLADLHLQVEPGATFTIDLRKTVGWPIAGKVSGLKDLGLSGAVISVEPPGEVKRGDLSFDALVCDEEGHFETGRIAPGKYRVHVDGYLPKQPAKPWNALLIEGDVDGYQPKQSTKPGEFRGGLELPPYARLPDFTADAEVTVTKDEQPPALHLELKKGGESRAFRELMQYHEQPHPAPMDEFLAAPAEPSGEKADEAKGKTSPPEPIEISGTVVDDETGQPVTKFDEQGGRIDDKDPTKIIWGYWLSPNAGDSLGRFHANVNWADGWRARIVAGGYISAPIFSEPPKAGSTKITDLVIRLKRGKSAVGRVLDHQGKPVAGASLFLVGKRPVSITGGKAMTDGAYGWGEDKSIIRYQTDADGKFVLPGIGGDDPQKIAISCPRLDLWVVPITGETPLDDLTLRLPEPGKLRIKYNIAGGPDEGQLFLQMHTFDILGWESVDNRRYPTIKRGAELTLDNLPPGLYEVVRQKQLSGEGFGMTSFLDRRQVTIESGKTVNTDFVRNAGAPVTGEIVGLDREDIARAKPTGVVVSVDLPKHGDLSPKFDEFVLRPDADGKIVGTFKTETIPPGDYVVNVQVFIPETEEQRHRTGIVPPGFIGEAKVTVPEQGALEPVKIELKPWEFPKPGKAAPRRGNTGAAPAGLPADSASGNPPRVAVLQPIERDVVDYQDYVGRTESIETVDLKARTTGLLTKVAFRGGETVKQGDLLFEIDPRLNQAELDKSEAELQGTEARLKRAAVDLNRAKALAATGTLSAEELNRIIGDRDEAEAALRVARSTLEIAKLRLSFTKVVAPISGKISQPLLAAGNLVNADVTILAKIDAIDPMYVKFDVDERTYLQLKGRKEGKAVGKDGEPTVLIKFADEKGWPHRATIENVETRLNSDTGTIAFRAVFSNADGLFLPGMFARVRLPTGSPHTALLVPQEAVAVEQSPPYILVVNEKNLAVLRRVRLAGIHDGWSELTEGLSKTEWVVKNCAGLRPDTVVSPQREDNSFDKQSPAMKPK